MRSRKTYLKAKQGQGINKRDGGNNQINNKIKSFFHDWLTFIICFLTVPIINYMLTAIIICFIVDIAIRPERANLETLTFFQRISYPIIQKSIKNIMQLSNYQIVCLAVWIMSPTCIQILMDDKWFWVKKIAKQESIFTVCIVFLIISCLIVFPPIAFFYIQ
ncbi:hypothetical protein Dred_0943 [Desulforamulus reducens MI-1]|uniref:Uncharacterized protein n=2 Tax=Desulforamulus TaxID=2916693 RepID=A4J325_DESRM|nr:hypothetical protein Dred_0943 [Desulforamulus reducens MI-1]